jgi:hypothetical protein
MAERARTVTESAAAECQACDWKDDAGGALGRAALHHDRTGHEVLTVIVRDVRYGNRDATLAAQGQGRLEGLE